MKEDSNEFYIAIPHAIIDYKETAFYQGIYTSYFSDPLGFFLVKPIRSFRWFRDQYEGLCLRRPIIGFKDYKTGKKIIDAILVTNKEGNTDVVYRDVLSSVQPSVGDVHWEVCLPNSHSGYKTKIERYKRLTNEEILDRLYSIHNEAQELAETARINKNRK